MMFNVSEFKSQLSKRGFAKNNLFSTRISLPSNMSDLEEHITTRDLTFFCQGMSLPSMELSFFEYKPQGFGRAEKRPNDYRSGEIIGTFMVDSNFAVQKFFHKWMQEIINIGDYYGNVVPDEKGKLPFVFEYKENYTATMEVLQFSEHNPDKVYYWKFGNLFPVNIGNVDLNWGSQDLLLLPVNFAYDIMNVDAFTVGDMSKNNPAQDYIDYSASRMNDVYSISRSNNSSSIQDIINQFTTVSDAIKYF